MLRQSVQTALRVLFPPACAACGGQTESEYALCGPCWRKVPLISGPVCLKCGVPILAEHGGDDDICEECCVMPRVWHQGRAAMLYRDLGRTLVLRLKHGDRPDIARAVTGWMVQAATPLVEEDTICAPVPLHWSRLVKRRFNQAAILSQNVAISLGTPAVLDLLVRTRRTLPLDGVGIDDRYARLDGAIMANPARAARLRDRPVLLVDDVLTSGATLSAAAKACLDAGARRVDILTLARVAKDT